jgi:hypothetical protein
MTHKKLKSLHGNSVYLSAEDILVGNKALGTGGQGGKASVVLPGSDSYTAIWEDFLGDVTYDATADTGSAGPYFHVAVEDNASSSALVAGVTNGIYRITQSGAADGGPNASRGITGKGLNWKADQGPGVGGSLRIAARVKMGAYPRKGVAGGGSGLYVGFTDTLTAEFPAYDTGAADTGGVQQAADHVGIMWNYGGDTGFVAVAGANTVEKGIVALTKTAPTDNKWVTLEVQVNSGTSDTGGIATFYVDGVNLGQIVAPVTSNTALTPCIYHYDTGASNTLDIDWVNVSAPRDTGV